ncbi:hypothetical protein MNBD_CPR01-234 [hydrothermal vent metagenome]|uniref:Uncharacterized protein n=1 Tax=hydrothermal vent metagenome TaxID=652676 RepID=A0A3B0V4U8_9ZZZZ
MQRRLLFIFIVIAFITGGVFVWGLQYIPVVTTISARFNEIKTTVSNIRAPEGWYAWGLETSPSAVSNPTAAEVKFGNDPKNTSGNLQSSLILVRGDGLDGKTPEEWMNYRKTYFGVDFSLRTATSSVRTWAIENNRFVIGSITETPAGGRVLTYYLFNDGIVYTFMLTPSPFVPGYQERSKNILNSSDADTLRGIVKQFADSLPSTKT